MKGILFIMLLTSSSVFAQSFFVEPTEKGFEKDIVAKMNYDGYKLAPDLQASDYKVECLVDGKYNAWAIKKMFHGYVRISDSKTGNEIARTKEVGKSPSAYNRFQAGPAIMSKIAKAELKKTLDVVIQDFRKKQSESKTVWVEHGSDVPLTVKEASTYLGEPEVSLDAKVLQGAR